ncbi:MAG: hypothetical protein COX57_09940 [Alphaproteobacteria bacterium CG_4_10_14_0_2_um_filter_63_37]|nr:MAG: hypothetical protein AUJ55_03965 [Proteobacteria bacterium CG1_02_64_396]PJA24103.1 MAG: hypothetical protein COX57_09940 [Alphaproteobacteria bacterium CG_4_10_14_0_2_um_filter_63_37]
MTQLDMTAFYAGFVEEATERLQEFSRGLLALEQGKKDEDILAQMARNAHTIKGSANMLGLTDIGKTGHVMEDALNRLKTNPEQASRDLVDLLLEMTDALGERLSTLLETQNAPKLLDTERFSKSMTQVLAAGDKGVATAPEPSSQVAAPPSAAPPSASPKPQQISDEVPASSRPAAEVRPSRQEEPSKEKESPEKRDRAAPPTGGREDSKDSPFIPSDHRVTDGGSGSSSFTPSGRSVRLPVERIEALSTHIVELTIDKSQAEEGSRVFQRLVDDHQYTLRAWTEIHDFLQDSGYLSGGDVEHLQDVDRRFVEIQRRLERFLQDLKSEIFRRNLLMEDLRNRVLALAMKPLASLFLALPRSVRDLARRYDKQIELITSGEEIELDRSVVDALMEPLIHLINNAIAHGVEQPDVRREKGKNPVGYIGVHARQMGSEVVIHIEDDGRGIDHEEIRRVAVSRGVTTAREATEMLPGDLIELIFRPGFSTASGISDISGRGVGMDVVRSTVRRLTGSVKVDTRLGEGSRFTLTIPLTIAVQKAVIFTLGKRRYALLSHMVSSAIRHANAEILKVERREVIRRDRHIIPLVNLGRIFGTDESYHSGDDTERTILIAKHLEGEIGLIVDQVIDEVEIVVNDLDPYLKRFQLQGVLGSTILGDGMIALILEPQGIKEMARTAPMHIESASDLRPSSAQTGRRSNRAVKVLLVDDSLIARQVERAVLEKNGFDVETAIDGVDALEKLENTAVDIIISDIEMPRMDGYGLIQKLRSDRRFIQTPIVFITTRESDEDKRKSFELGADAFLIKQDLEQGSMIQTLMELAQRG